MTTVIIHALQVVNVIVPGTDDEEGIFDETFDETFE